MGRLLWAGLRLAVARAQRMLILGGLAVALSMPNPLTAQLSLEGLTPQQRLILSSVLAVLGAGILTSGLRSPWLMRLRRLLRRRGWFLTSPSH